ncbi:MAG: alpha/beta fold hydrolase [Ferruginibacter sp.]
MKRRLKYLFFTLLILFGLLNIVVIFHAYKFTHFYNAGEVIVKKKEEKTKGDIIKEMLFGQNFTKLQNIKADSSFNTFYLTTKDSIKLEGWYFPAQNAKGTIAMFHGHGGSKTGMMEASRAFNELGYNTALIDFRAHGGSDGNTCTIGWDEAEDVKLAYDFVKQNGENNIVLWGSSLGAATILKSVQQYQLQPSKLILEMPFGSLKEAVKGRIKMMNLPPEPVTTLLTFWGGTIHGFWAFNLKPAEYAKEIKCPVLLQRGKNDTRVTQKETDDIYANIPGQKEMVLYDSCGHEMLCKKEKEKWRSAVSRFLTN